MCIFLAVTGCAPYKYDFAPNFYGFTVLCYAERGIAAASCLSSI